MKTLNNINFNIDDDGEIDLDIKPISPPLYSYHVQEFSKEAIVKKCEKLKQSGFDFESFRQKRHDHYAEKLDDLSIKLALLEQEKAEIKDFNKQLEHYRYLSAQIREHNFKRIQVKMNFDKICHRKDKSEYNKGDLYMMLSHEKLIEERDEKQDEYNYSPPVPRFP